MISFPPLSSIIAVIDNDYGFLKCLLISPNMNVCSTSPPPPSPSNVTHPAPTMSLATSNVWTDFPAHIVPNMPTSTGSPEGAFWMRTFDLDSQRLFRWRCTVGCEDITDNPKEQLKSGISWAQLGGAALIWLQSGGSWTSRALTSLKPNVS